MKITHLCLASLFCDNLSYQENVLVKKHSQLGFEVSVIARSDQRILDNSVIESDYSFLHTEYYDIYRAKREPSLFKINEYLNRYSNIFGRLIQIKPDILFIHGPQFGNAKDIIKYKKKFPKTKIYVDNHNDYYNSGYNASFKKRILHKFYFGVAARKLDKITNIWWGTLPIRCDFLIDIYKINSSKVKFLPMGIDDDLLYKINSKSKHEFKESLGIQNEFIISSGGKLTRDKNLKELIAYLNEFHFNNPSFKFKLLLFGDIDKDYKKDIEHLNYNFDVKWLGWCSPEQIVSILSITDLAIYLGGHSVLWEQTVALGTPSIFRKYEGIQHLNFNNNCLFIDYNDFSSLPDTLSKIIIKEDFNKLKKAAQSSKKGFLFYSNIAKKAIEY